MGEMAPLAITKRGGQGGEYVLGQETAQKILCRFFPRSVPFRNRARKQSLFERERARVKVMTLEAFVALSQ